MFKIREYKLAISFTNIHNIITRGIRVTRESIHWFLIRPSQLPSRQQGFLSYVRTLVSVMDSHQLNEDYLIFPYFRGLLPSAPYILMKANHREMVHLFDEIDGIIDQCEARGICQVSDLRKLNSTFSRLNSIWQKHIKIETGRFIRKIDALIPEDEQDRLVRLFEEYNQTHSEPAYLVIPFLLFNLPREEREVFARGIPLELTHHLVPNVWKEKWEAMTPFLLV